MRLLWLLVLSLSGGAVLMAEEKPVALDAPFAVTVFCGASRETAVSYLEVARDVGRAIGGRRWTLVYGGGRTGSMGALAEGADAAGGRIESVLPRFLDRPSVVFPGADEVQFVETMAQRKAELQARAVAVVILPGGFGTLDELADTLELARFGLLEKPIFLLNQGGYFDPLLAFFGRIAGVGFASDDGRTRLTVVETVEELLQRLEHAGAGRRPVVAAEAGAPR